MEYGFAIVMFIFTLSILIIGFSIYEGNYNLIYRSSFTKVKDKKKYCKYFGKCMFVCSSVTFLSGLSFLLFKNVLISMIIFVVVLIISIIIISKKDKP